MAISYPFPNKHRLHSESEAIGNQLSISNWVYVHWDCEGVYVANKGFMMKL